MSADRFEDLYERYCDGALSAAERSEFLDLMEDPAVRARFVEMSTFEAVMSDEARVAQGSSRGSDTSSIRKSVSRTRVSANRLRRGREPRSVWPIALVSAVAAVLFAVILVSVPGGAKRPAAEPAPVVRRASEPVVRELPRDLNPVHAPERPPVRERGWAPKSRRPVAPEPPDHGKGSTRPSVPKTQAPPRPTPEPKAPAKKPKATAVEKRTIAFIGRLERVTGRVLLGTEPAQPGAGVVSGVALSTPDSSGSAVVRLIDGTEAELDGETRLSRIALDDGGVKLRLERGVVWVDAAKQPEGRTVSVDGPHAGATVLGTAFSLKATEAYTRLDVTEGRVRFTSASGVSSQTVAAGQYAVAGRGYPFTARSRYTQWKAPARNLVLWLRADEGAALEGTTVAKWIDQSPAKQDAVQTEPDLRPEWVPEAVGGMPAVRFDGTNDFFKLPDGFKDFRAGLSAFVVVRVGPTPGWMRFLDLGRAPGCENITFGRKDTGDKLTYWSYNQGVTRGKVEAPNAILFDRPQTLSVVATSAGRATLFRDGRTVGTGSTSAAPNMVRTPNYIGRSNYGAGEPRLKGDVCEILLFNRALPDGERAYVESYLRQKYYDPTAPPMRAR